ncbi:Transcription factor GAMYB [Acorus calamus]|uniref:Transcription factor GAMYB n=1 Tax=Acorus calamus TaxID=4465 RepID=A0AAV9F1L7_ACOCL|nr:Transcription factor GAMYB [Acorus calamus]
MGPTPRTGVPELKSQKKRWSEEEGKILLDQINKHGEKDWDQLRNVPGLNSRSGKSCRLRWFNHLRPGLNKDSLTEAEKQKINDLQKRLGNKWAKIAKHVSCIGLATIQNSHCVPKDLQYRPTATMEQQWPSSSAMNQNMNDQYVAANTLHDELRDTPLQPLNVNQYVDVVEPLPLPVNNIDTVSYAALLQNSSNAAMEIHQWPPSFAMNQTVNDHYVDVNMQHDMKDLSYGGSPDPAITETLFSLSDSLDHYPMFDLSLFQNIWPTQVAHESLKDQYFVTNESDLPNKP